MTFKLSPSKLNLLENCPRCFYLEVIKKISRPGLGFPSLPSGIDKMLKEHFDRFMEKEQLPPELTILKDEKVKLFNNKELLKKWRNNRTGIEFFDSENGILFHGAIDNILQKNNKLIVLDYKTKGFPVKENDHHFYQDQLNCYNFLLRKNNYDTEDYSYLLFYVPDKFLENGEFLFKTELRKVNINVKHAEDLYKKAVKVLNNGMPDCNEKCVFCKWKEL